MEVKALRLRRVGEVVGVLNALLKGVLHPIHSRWLEDPTEVEAGFPREGVAAMVEGVVVDLPNSSMVAPLNIIKVGGGEGLLSKEGVVGTVGAEVVGAQAVVVA